MEPRTLQPLFPFLPLGSEDNLPSVCLSFDGLLRSKPSQFLTGINPILWRRPDYKACEVLREGRDPLQLRMYHIRPGKNQLKIFMQQKAELSCT